MHQQSVDIRQELTGRCFNIYCGHIYISTLILLIHFIYFSLSLRHIKLSTKSIHEPMGLERKEARNKH